MILLIFLGYLSVLLPEPSNKIIKWVEKGEISLPYGFLYSFEDTNKIDVSIYSVVDTVNFVHFSPTFEYRIGHWRGIISPYGRYGGDYFYPKKKKFGIYSDIIRSSLFYKNDYILFSFGKDIFSIGPAFEDNPLLSPNVPLNYISFTFRRNKYAFTHFISRLCNYEGVEIEWDDTTKGYVKNVNRYLGIHRVEIKPLDWIAFSFSEAMLIGEESLGLPFELFAPFTIYYVEQYNRELNMNILWNIDVVMIKGKFYFYFDFFIDDFQYESDPWKEPNHIGIYTGLKGRDFLKEGFELNFYYSILTRWTYNNLIVWQRYMERDLPLGSMLGCDYDKVVLKAIYPLVSFKFGGMVSYTRRGENRITTPWPVNTYNPPSPENEFKGTNFLSGIIERRLTLSAIFKYEDIIELVSGVSFFQNYEHDKYKNKILPSIELKLKLSTK
ncbi:MAG: capsule assembly Wzi family protein [candidate division WOR-3 bacterium]